MPKIILDGVEYDDNILGEKTKKALSSSRYVAKKITELDMIIEALQIAKIAYLNELKKEILKSKAGL